MGNTEIALLLAYISCTIIIGFAIFIVLWIFGGDINGFVARVLSRIMNWIDGVYDFMLWVILGKEEKERNLP